MGYSTKKFLITVLGILAFIPLIWLMPGVNDSLPNQVGTVMGVGQLAIFCAAAGSFKPWQFGSFLCGLILILLGVGFYVVMGNFEESAKAAEHAGRFSVKDVKFWTEGVPLWQYTVPVFSIGIGINIISSFISSTPPAQSDD